MVVVVVICNLLIAGVCLYVAWQVWKLRKALAAAADALVIAERSTYAVLHGSPEFVLRGQGGTHHLRQQYRQLELQIRKVEQILSLLGVGQIVWQWYARSMARRSSYEVPALSPTELLELRQSSLARRARMRKSSNLRQDDR